MSIAQHTLRGLTPLTIALSLVCASPAAFAAEGYLDRSFGIDGQVAVPRKVNGFDMALQADGKILTVSGIGETGEEIARYNRDGTLDRSFADGGILDTQTPYLITRIAVQPDGKILFLSPDGGLPGARILVKRYHADGRPDTDFGVGGAQRTPMPGFVFAGSLRVQGDGKIVAMGYSIGADLSGNYLAMARYHPDGRLDTGFGNGGTIMMTYDNQLVPDEMVVQPDGKLLVVGGYAQAWDYAKIVLVRFDSDGRLDTGFGSGGWQFSPSSRTGGWPDHGVALQADGKILVSAPLSRYNSTVLRFLSDGRRDDSFVAPQLDGGMADIAVQADGRIVVAGRKFDPPSGDRSFGIVSRLDPDGAIDPDFQAERIDFGGYNDTVFVVAIQPDGRIVAFGGEEIVGDTQNTGLARLGAKTYCIADASNPGRFLGFSDSGWFSTADSGPGGSGWGLVGRGRASAAHAPDGRWEWHSLLASRATPPGYVAIGTARLDADGTRPGPGSALVIGAGAAPVGYALAARRVNQHNCTLRPGPGD